MSGAKDSMGCIGILVILLFVGGSSWAYSRFIAGRESAPEPVKGAHQQGKHPESWS